MFRVEKLESVLATKDEEIHLKALLFITSVKIHRENPASPADSPVSNKVGILNLSLLSDTIKMK